MDVLDGAIRPGYLRILLTSTYQDMVPGQVIGSDYPKRLWELRFKERRKSYTPEWKDINRAFTDLGNIYYVATTPDVSGGAGPLIDPVLELVTPRPGYVPIMGHRFYKEISEQLETIGACCILVHITNKGSGWGHAIEFHILRRGKYKDVMANVFNTGLRLDTGDED